MQLVGVPPSGRRIIRLIGSGGMGVVYEALDERLDRRVALKVLHPHLTTQEETRNRLLKEARLAARVEHDNVVRIYNVHEDGTDLCLEMQYVEGVPLSQLILVRPVTPSHAVNLLRQALEALAACHASHVVHGDLKPGNLLVTPDGKILLADFGISRAIYPGGGSGLANSTLSGGLWGTPQYCPPEAWRCGLPDISWDMYALGVLAHEALCGAFPFAAETPAMLMREKLEGTQIPISSRRSDLSPEFSTLIDSLTAEAPETRPATALEALEQLRNVPESGEDFRLAEPLHHTETAATVSISLAPSAINTAPELGRAAIGRFFPALASLLVVGMLALAAFAIYRFLPASVVVQQSEGDPFIGAVGNVGDVLNLFAHESHALFSYDDGTRGRELWTADDDGQLGMVQDINPGAGSSNPGDFIARQGNSFLFTATTNREGMEPWLFDSIPPQTHMLLDLVPGPMYSDPKPITSWENLFFFYASTMGRGECIWITDSSQSRTGCLMDFNPAAAALGSRNNLLIVDPDGFCVAQRAGRNSELLRYWFANGTVERLGKISGDVRDLAMLGEVCVFTMSDPEYGFELWKTDIHEKETQLVKDIWPGTESGDPLEFYVWNGEIYFRATTLDHGSELWKTDGTPEGTVEVCDINPKTFQGSPAIFKGTKNQLFFRATHENYGVELFATTGVPGSVPRVFDLWPGRESSTPYGLVVIDDYLFFSANDGVHGEELWALDLTSEENEPFLVEDIRSGRESAEPHDFAPIGQHAGIFVYKKVIGEGLMRLIVDGKHIELKPYDALPLQVEAGTNSRRESGRE